MNVIKMYVINERSPSGDSVVFRQFRCNMSTGVIIEIFDQDLLKAAQSKFFTTTAGGAAGGAAGSAAAGFADASASPSMP